MFESYSFALVALALMVLLCSALAPYSAVTKSKAGLAPGAAPKADYSDPVYRIYRAFSNALESLPVFASALLAAILAGAAPFWINLFASIYILSRIAMTFLHIKGIGKAEGGPRSMAYGVSWLMTLLIGLFGLLAALF